MAFNSLPPCRPPYGATSLAYRREFVGLLDHAKALAAAEKKAP